MTGEETNNAAITLVLVMHLVWILWVIFGAFFTRGHRWLSGFHLASLIWGILVEVGPWLCPLTMAEDFFQRRAGLRPVGGDFLNHCIRSVVYPEVSVTLLTVLGVGVCVANLAVYAERFFRWVRCRQNA
ncbi:MAG: DUF2784 domain-containing protein [Acidobacteriota bacterium]